MEKIIFFYPEGHEAHFERGHPERPERVEVIKDAFVESGVWGENSICSPLDLDEETYAAVHSPAYLNLLEMTCRRGGRLDQDTYTTPASWHLAHQAAGGAAAVASVVWEGAAKCGFALTRPPGHHAMRGQGMGFCLLNNIALAAQYLLGKKGVKKLAIIDLDLHHGNGTQDIFWERDDVFYLSTHQAPFYPGTGRVDEIGKGPGYGWTANVPLPAGSGDQAFLAVTDELILPLFDQKKPEIILVSYGFDTHWLDPLGQLLLTADGYGKVINKLRTWADQYCDGKISLFLEGGYDLNAAKVCSMAVLNALMGNEWQDYFPCPYQENNGWQKTLKQAQIIWNL